MLDRLSLYWQTASPAERAWAAVALACLLACAALVLSLRACDAPAEPDPVEETREATDASRERTRPALDGIDSTARRAEREARDAAEPPPVVTPTPSTAEARCRWLRSTGRPIPNDCL